MIKQKIKKLNKKNNRDIEIKLNDGIFGKWSFVNKNYELLKSVDNISSSEKWTTVKMFFKQKLALFGFITMSLVVILSLIMTLFLNDPRHVDPLNNHGKLFTNGFILGTDFLGRDIWARLWYGIRFSITIAAIVVVIDLLIGFVFGSLMGFFPMIDAIGQFIIKVLVNLPTTVILILLAIVLSPSFWTIVLGLTLTGWVGMANQVRGYVIKTRSQDWVVASRTLGTSKVKVLFKKMLPHLLPIVFAQLVFTIPGALLGDLTLSVLGLSIPNTPTLGSLLDAGRQFILIYPREAIVPVIVVTIMLTSVQFVGFGMQKAVERGV